MKSNRPYPSVTITKKGQRFIEGGHVWVYAEEITAADAPIENGALVDVLWLVFEKVGVLSTGLYEMVPGVILSIIAAVAVTLLDKAPAKEVTDIYDTATAPNAFEGEE